MATQMHTDLVGVQQAQQAQSLGEKLDVLHTDLGSLLSGQSGGTTTLGAKLDTLHGDLGTTLHADLGAVVTALVGSGAGDNLADLLVALGDVTASVRDTLHGDLGAVMGATQSVRSEVTALGTLLHGDLGTQSSTLSGLRADITALGLLVARTNTLLGDSDFSAVGSRGINYLTFGLVGQNDQKFYPAHFAEGGLVTGALHALVGEAGPELIVPLDRVERLFDSLGAAHGAAPAARPAITAVYAPTVREEVSEGTFDELIWSLDQKYRGRF